VRFVSKQPLLTPAVCPPLALCCRPTFTNRTTDWNPGGIHAFNFDGTSQYIPIANLFFDSAGALPEFTVGIWFRTDYLTTSTGSNSLSEFDNWALLDFDRSEYFNIFTDSLANVRFSTSHTDGVFKDSYDSGAPLGATTLASAQYHYITASFKWTGGSDGIKYIHRDGELTMTDEGSYSSVGVAANSVRYGIIGDGSEARSFDAGRNRKYFSGDIAMLHMYQTFLPSADVKAHYDGEFY
jgi:hypothetical protein